MTTPKTLYDSPLSRVVELVELLSEKSSSEAFDAVACARLRHAADVDPLTIVADALLMLRPRIKRKLSGPDLVAPSVPDPKAAIITLVSD